MCTVAQMIRDAKDPDQREVIEMVLEDEDGYSNEFAANVLSRSSVLAPTLSAEQVRDHRRKKCPCYKRIE